MRDDAFLNASSLVVVVVVVVVVVGEEKFDDAFGKLF
jgi:Sec-independent protein translocase protein TatA